MLCIRVKIYTELGINRNCYRRYPALVSDPPNRFNCSASVNA